MRRILLILSLFLTNSVAGFCQDTIQPKVSLAQNAEFFSKGIEEKYNENFDIAIGYFEEALKAFPEDHASMYELSALYTNKGMPEKGFDMIKNAVEDDLDVLFMKSIYDFLEIIICSEPRVDQAVVTGVVTMCV